jgi:hypothetical protein
MKIINRIKTIIKNNTFKDIIRKLLRYFVNIEIHYKLDLNKDTFRNILDKYKNYKLQILDNYTLIQMMDSYPLEISESTYNNLAKSLGSNYFSKCYVIYDLDQIAGFVNVAPGYIFDSKKNKYIECNKNVYFFASYTFHNFRAKGVQTYARAKLIETYKNDGYLTSTGFIQQGNWRNKKSIDKFDVVWEKKVIKYNLFGFKIIRVKQLSY